MSKQKTPLAELIQIIKKEKEQADPIFGIVFLLLEKQATVLLSKEREAFINAAQEVNLEKVSMTGEEWFNENFEQ